MTIITPNSISGHDSGTAADLATDDGNRVTVAEENQQPGWCFGAVYTGVGSGPHLLRMNGRYRHNGAHEKIVEILNISAAPTYDSVTAEADDMPHQADGVDQDYVMMLPMPLTDYVTGGVLDLQIDHVTMGGVSADSLLMDMMVLDSVAILFWVGGDTSWDTTANWATTSTGTGGEEGADVPGDGVIATFTGDDVTNCTLDVNTADLGGLDLQAGYSGDFSCGSGRTISINGGTFSGKSTGLLDATDCTISITDGTFDISTQVSGGGTWDRGTSSIVLNGTCTLTTATAGLPLHAVTIAASGTTTTGSTIGAIRDTFTVDGIFVVDTGHGVFTVGSTVLGAAGQITGDGTWIISRGGTFDTFPETATVDVATVVVDQPTAATVVAAGTYKAGLLKVTKQATASELRPNGTYVCQGDCEFESAGANTLTIKLDTNNPTILVQSDLILDVDAGTVAVIGGSGGFTVQGDVVNQIVGTCTWTQAITFDGATDQGIDFGGVTVADVTITKSVGEIDFTSGDFTLGANSTANDFVVSGDADFDMATFNLTLADGANFTANSSGTFDCGSGTISLTNGNFDNSGQTTWTRGTSTIVLNGTCTVKGSGFAKPLNDITFSASSVITVTASTVATGVFTVLGDVTLDATIAVSTTGDMVIGADATISGTSFVSLVSSTSGHGLISLNPTALVTATLDCINPQAGTVIAAGTYASAVLRNSIASVAVLELNGTYVFTGDVTLQNINGGGSFTLADNTNNPDITIQGDVIFTETAGTITWTKGDGTITLSGGNANIDWDGSTIEDLVVDATGTKTFVAGWTADSYTQRAGTVDFNGQTLQTVGDWIMNSGSIADPESSTLTVGGQFRATGVNLIGSAEWFLDVSESAIMRNLTVAKCNASGGKRVDCYGCTDGGDNINFRFLPASSGGGSMRAHDREPEPMIPF